MSLVDVSPKSESLSLLPDLEELISIVRSRGLNGWRPHIMLLSLSMIAAVCSNEKRVAERWAEGKQQLGATQVEERRKESLGGLNGWSCRDKADRALGINAGEYGRCKVNDVEYGMGDLDICTSLVFQLVHSSLKRAPPALSALMMSQRSCKCISPPKQDAIGPLTRTNRLVPSLLHQPDFAPASVLDRIPLASPKRWNSTTAQSHHAHRTNCLLLDGFLLLSKALRALCHGLASLELSACLDRH